MSYIDDLEGLQPEIFSEPIGKLSRLSGEIASGIFPDVVIHDSPNLWYFPFKLCHSYPKINARGRTFSPNVLFNSFASLNDQIIDLDHNLESNGLGPDRIVGYVKATDFTLPKKYSDLEIANLKTPLPVNGLGVIFLRASGASEALEEHVNGDATYACSMECAHAWSDAYFLYQQELIPVKDAELGMKNCITPDSVKKYKGKPLCVFLGGLNESIDFWAVALTKTPADNLATADMFHYIGGQSKEVSSRCHANSSHLNKKKTFFMPLRQYTSRQLELANTTVDKIVSEAASITIVGATDPDVTDGHVHEILSDLTLLPAESSTYGSHLHYCRGFHVSRGSNPSLTGVTDTCHSPDVHCPSCCSSSCSCDEPHPPQERKVHVHTVNVQLKGKYKTDNPLNDVDDVLLDDESYTQTEVAEMKRKLSELLNDLESHVSRLVKATTDSDRNSIQLEIANKQREIAELNSKEVSESDKQSFLDQQVKEGRFFSKEKADELVASAVTTATKELEEKHKKEAEELRIRQVRLDKCNEMKIDLNTEYQGVLAADGTNMTFRKKLDLLGVDASGDQQFNMDLMVWSQLSKPIEEPAPVVSQQQPIEAANAANVKKVPPVRKVLALASAGGTGNEDAELAAVEAKKKAAAKIPNHMRGRSLFASKT